MTVILDTIALGTPLKRVLIDGAFSLCGISPDEFGIEPEQAIAGLRALNLIMAQFPASGYVQPRYGDGDLSDFSGVQIDMQGHVTAALALQIAPNYGVELSSSARLLAASGMDAMRARWAVIPVRQYPRGGQRYSGNRRYGWVWGYGEALHEPIYVPPVTAPVAPTIGNTTVSSMLMLSEVGGAEDAFAELDARLTALGV